MPAAAVCPGRRPSRGCPRAWPIASHRARRQVPSRWDPSDSSASRRSSRADAAAAATGQAACRVSAASWRPGCRRCTAIKKRRRKLPNLVRTEREISRKRSIISSGLPCRTVTRITGWPVVREKESLEQPKATSQRLRPSRGSKPAVVL
eukprot:3882929-Pleurochrysis_carterae.AAC.4